MKFKLLFLAAGLACATTAASANTVLTATTDWGAHPTVGVGFDSFQAFQTGDTFTDVYTFSLAGPATLDAVVFALDEGPFYNLKNASFELFSGTQSSSTLVSQMPLAGLGPTSTDFKLAGGKYFYEVTGTVNGSNGGGYGFTSSLEPVPEPSTMALVLAGVGLMVLTARRRGTKS